MEGCAESERDCKKELKDGGMIKKCVQTESQTPSIGYQVKTNKVIYGVSGCSPTESQRKGKAPVPQRQLQ